MAGKVLSIKYNEEDYKRIKLFYELGIQIGIVDGTFNKMIREVIELGMKRLVIQEFAYLDKGYCRIDASELENRYNMSEEVFENYKKAFDESQQLFSKNCEKICEMFGFDYVPGAPTVIITPDMTETLEEQERRMIEEMYERMEKAGDMYDELKAIEDMINDSTLSEEQKQKIINEAKKCLDMEKDAEEKREKEKKDRYLENVVRVRRK